MNERERLELARSSIRYPVTPGDVYLLTYDATGEAGATEGAAGGAAGGPAEGVGGRATLRLTVEPSGIVKLGRYGEIDGAGLTFPELERRVVARVADEAPRSFPRLRIESPARFYVTLEGEVSESVRVEAWGLTRLAEVLEGHLTEFGSLRRVEVARGAAWSATARGATARGAAARQAAAPEVYDVFAAARWGDDGENPLIRPGDVVTVREYERRVVLNGAVRRPGAYQLLEGEGLRALIERYGGGLRDGADRRRIRIQTCPELVDCETRVRFASLEGESPGELILRDGDRVTVENREEYLPFVHIEGAVGDARRESRFEMTTDRIRFRLRPGDRLSSVMREISDEFLPESDLAAVYVERQGRAEPIEVNVERLLYSGDAPANDLVLIAEDRIVVPFRQFFVTVSGAVDDPGQYPFIPNRNFRYYLGLAGGIDPERRIGTNPRIRDVDGRRRKDDVIIEPEDAIHFRSNNPAFYMQFITPVLSVVSAGLSTWALINSMD